MFDRIVLAVDGSGPSERAEGVAAETAEKFSSDVTVVHVLEHEFSWMGDLAIETPDEASQLADDVVRRLKDRGLTARGEVRHAPVALVAREILDVAKEADAGLIVMGTRGLTDWKGLLLGSVAHKVMQHATCPVLLVRIEEELHG